MNFLNKTKILSFRPYCLAMLLLTMLSINSFAQKDVSHKSLKTDNAKRASLNKKKKIITKYSGNDGPYIINDTLYRVNSEDQLVILPGFNRDSVTVKVNNEDKNEFSVSLQEEYTIPKTIYKLPKKMVVLSDIEGNYNAFASFLYANHLIDENHNWIYDDGHLVLIGDFVDRGKNVTQVLWLIYKLEQQAKKHNGVVHFILGNHEILNFNGDYRYNRKKYVKAAQEISKIEDNKEAVKYMYSENSELGKWLTTKNVIEKIGDYIFVHGGLSPRILNYEISLSEINNMVRFNFVKKIRSEDLTTKFLFSSKGPFWYRGFFYKTRSYKKISSSGLSRVLDYYDSKKIVIGHTNVVNISTSYNGKIIRTDVKHGKEKYSRKTQGLLIEDNIEFVIDASFTKRPLK